MTQLPLPAYLKGKNMSVAAVQPFTVSDSGGLTYGTNVDLVPLGVIDTWHFRQTLNGFEKHPTNYNVANNLGTFYDFELTVGEILRAALPSVLNIAYANGPWLRFEAQVVSDNNVLNLKLVLLATFAGGGGVEMGHVEDENGAVATLRPVGVLPYYGNGTPPF